MTKLEIIEETANYYNLGNRAENTNPEGKTQCLYLTKDGRMCAVGRTLLDPGLYGDGGVTDICGGSPPTLWNLQKEPYRGHELNFWVDIQVFHDEVGF